MQPSNTITVNILFFAKARDITTVPEIDLILPKESNTIYLIQKLLQLYPSLEVILDTSILAVNQEYTTDIVNLKSGDEIAIIPPVSGG